MKTLVTIAVPLARFESAKDLPRHISSLLEALAAIESPWLFELAVCVGHNVCHSRNQMVAEFMRGEGRYILFLDDDLLATPDDVLRILSHKLHIVAGMYVTREAKAHWVLNPYREAVVNDNGLLPVGEIGTGFKCYHRSVFEYLSKQEPTLGYIEDDGSTSWGFFCMGVVQADGRSRFLTEDYWMDQLCRKHNILVHADTKIRLIHQDRITGKAYPLNNQWPVLPKPVPPMIPPPLAEDFEPVSTPGKLVLALQYWEGDREQAVRLAKFIADLEPTYRHDVEFCFIKRWDATFDQDAMEHVSKKFLVHCRTTPHHPIGYPIGPNCMTFNTLHAATKWENVKAVLLFEYDCIPVAKDWLNQLIQEWDRAAGQGKLVLGSWRASNNPLGHINGNMLFDPKLASVVDLGKEPPEMAWDIFWPDVFQPHWMRSGLVANRHRETNVSEARILTPECGTKPPVLVHGVKSGCTWKVAEKLLK